MKVDENTDKNTDEEFSFDIVEDDDSNPGEQEPEQKEEEQQEEQLSEENKEDDTPAEEQESSEKTVKTYADLTEEEQQYYGKRAQRRISKLVGQTKSQTEELEALRAENAKLKSETKEFEVQSRSTQAATIDAHLNRLEAQEQAALQAIRAAREDANIDDELKAQDALAAVKAEKFLVDRAKKQMAAENEQFKRAAAEQDVEVERGRETPHTPRSEGGPDRDALNWQKRNLWFGDQEKPKFRVMTMTAMSIHEDLMSEGIDPRIDSEEYYAELDARIQKEFPEEFKEKRTPQGQQKVAGGSRTNGSGKKKITLSKRQVELAGRLGITPEAYARQLARQSNQ